MQAQALRNLGRGRKQVSGPPLLLRASGRWVLERHSHDCSKNEFRLATCGCHLEMVKEGW